MTKPLVVAIVSGGMDSVTLAHWLVANDVDVELVSVDYGQRHAKELDYAAECADRLHAPWSVIDLSSITKHLTGSALTDPDVDVPEGHYADDTMRATVVPNRNALMLSAAAAVAVAHGAKAVATGVHAGDHAVYPDCRPEFVDAMTQALAVGNEGFCVEGFHVMAPFVTIGKHDIARQGHQLGVPFDRTWSCYKGGDLHCGRCGTCVERIEAFHLAGVPDPTEYEAV